MKNNAAVKIRSGRSLKRRLADNWQLYLLLVPVVITITFCADGELTVDVEKHTLG